MSGQRSTPRIRLEPTTPARAIDGAQIVRRFLAGESVAELAANYGVFESVIEHYIRDAMEKVKR